MQNIFLVVSTWISIRVLAVLGYINDLPFLNSSKAPMIAYDTYLTMIIDLQNKINSALEGLELGNGSVCIFISLYPRYKAARLTFPLKIKMGIDPIQQIKASKSLGI